MKCYFSFFLSWLHLRFLFRSSVTSTTTKEHIKNIVNNIDAEKSVATNDDDRDLVKRTIVKYSGGIESFNAKVRNKVEKCYMELIE